MKRSELETAIKSINKIHFGYSSTQKNLYKGYQIAIACEVELMSGDYDTNEEYLFFSNAVKKCRITKTEEINQVIEYIISQAKNENLIKKIKSIVYNQNLI